MNSGGQIRPPFFGTIPNMPPPPPQPQQHGPGGATAPSPFYPNIPPPNFSLPPPNIGLGGGGHFPRFSGPMHNQQTFNPMALGGGAMNVPPPHPAINLPQASYNVNNNNNINNNNRSGINQGSNFNHGLMGGQMPNNPSNNIYNNNNNKGQHIFANNHQQSRQMPCVTDNIFNDGLKDVPCGFPHFKPTMPPPPVLQNSGPSSQFSPTPTPPQRGGGFGGRGGGVGFQGNNTSNGFHHHNNNNNNNHNNSNSHTNNKGRGGIRGGMNNNRGRGNNNNNNNNKGRGGNNNNGHQNGGQKAKEPKVDRRELPENNVFYCDTCDRGFKTHDKYKEHVDQHQKCTYKDCPFVAAPKLVQLHMNMQHRAGLATRIYGVKSQEDIKKWKEERRKNYPTSDNIKKKKEKIQDKIARGEMIETKEFGKMRGQNRGQGRDRGGRGRGRFGRDRGGRHANDDGSAKGVIDEDEDGPPEERKIERNDKEGDEVDLTKGTDSDDDESHASQKQHTKKKKKKKIVDLTTSPSKGDCKKKDESSLSLLSGYDSSSHDSDDSSDGHGDGNTEKAKTAKKAEHTVFMDDSNDDDGNRFGLISGSKDSGAGKDDGDENNSGTTEAVPGLDKTPQETNAMSGNLGNASRGNTTPEVAARDDSGTAPEVKAAAIKRGHQHSKGGGGGPPDKKPKFTPKPLPKSYTLLEKLLAKEIRRERNKILQCVHFIVKYKFFDNATD